MEPETQRTCFFDPRTKTQTIWYRKGNVLVAWTKRGGVVELFRCECIENESDDYFGVELPSYAPHQVVHLDVSHPEKASESCIVMFGDDISHEDDNPVGIAFKLDHLLRRPKPGETVRTYFKSVAQARDDSHVIEKAATPSIVEHFGDIEIIPAREPVVFI